MIEGAVEVEFGCVVEVGDFEEEVADIVDHGDDALPQLFVTGDGQDSILNGVAGNISIAEPIADLFEDAFHGDGDRHIAELERNFAVLRDADGFESAPIDVDGEAGDLLKEANDLLKGVVFKVEGDGGFVDALDDGPVLGGILEAGIVGTHEAELGPIFGVGEDFGDSPISRAAKVSGGRDQAILIFNFQKGVAFFLPVLNGCEILEVLG